MPTHNFPRIIGSNAVISQSGSFLALFAALAATEDTKEKQRRNDALYSRAICSYFGLGVRAKWLSFVPPSLPCLSYTKL